MRTSSLSIAPILILLIGAFGTGYANEEPVVEYAGCVELGTPLDRLACFDALESADETHLACSARTSTLERLNCFDQVAQGLEPDPEAPKPPPMPAAVEAKRDAAAPVSC